MSGGLYRVFDAAYPPATVPAGCSGVLGYIGGKRATNVWTLGEWQRFARLVQFPAYVPDLQAEKPIDAAVMACTLAREIGWAPWQTDRRVIVCDLETAIVRGWYAQFAGEIEQQGFTAVAYGSFSTVLENAASEVWAADWNGFAAQLPGQTVHAHQYTANQKVAGTEADFSVVDQWLYERGGQGARHT